ncbi:hypothetical protein AALP_AA8G191400 [Arabis alpina]|uniref:Uncharacterized protein n=1 Tax=Arabis alpina TaxID=50452 RepID=A0A087G810_ARAAL|nr:hypothetical protein AALP_AA8G191400 [Arabis alpina]
MAAAASTLLELIRHPPFSLTHHRSAMLCSDHQRKSNIDTRKTSVIKLQETTSVIRLQETTSVIKLQVGLLGSGRTLQRYLTRLAENADTSTSDGLRYVLIEATLALMRHSDYFISCYSSVDVKPSIKDGEQRFKKLSIEERVKFDDETLVNVNSILRRSSKTRTCTGLTNEYIVVTILVAAEGIHILQPINGSLDLKEALKKLQWIPRNNIMAVEVLWTPQNERDTLSERELLEDYPHLRLL